MRIESLQMRWSSALQQAIVKPIAHNFMIQSIMLEIIHSVLKSEHLGVAKLACPLTIEIRWS